MSISAELFPGMSAWLSSVPVTRNADLTAAMMLQALKVLRTGAVTPEVTPIAQRH
jgi:hypothetical protein